MAISHLATGYERAAQPSYGPWVALFAALAAVTAIGGTAARTSTDLIAPAVTLGLFVVAAVLALVGWRRRKPEAASLTYWDVAGLMALIGIFAATAVDPGHLTQVVFRPTAP